MKYRWITLVVMATLFVVFAGCTRPETPQQVATEFWRAMAEGDADSVVDLSTLADPGAFDGFDHDRLNTLPDFGRVVIEADRATIDTSLPAADAAEKNRREITTYLVRIDDQWLVDYQRTYRAVTEPSALSGLMGDINKFTEQLNDAVGSSSEQLSKQMDQIAEDFETYSEETGKKAEKILESFGQSLEELREDLRKSLDEARKKQQESQQPKQDPPGQTSI